MTMAHVIGFVAGGFAVGFIFVWGIATLLLRGEPPMRRREPDPLPMPRDAKLGRFDRGKYGYHIDNFRPNKKSKEFLESICSEPNANRADGLKPKQGDA